MGRAVAVVDLGQAVGYLDLVAVGTGGHVAEGQRVGQRLGRRGELAGQDAREAAFFGLDDGAGVVRDQAAQQGFGVLDVAEVAGTVQAVQAGFGELGEVADVVQPRGGLDQVGVVEAGRDRLTAGSVPGWTVSLSGLRLMLAQSVRQTYRRSSGPSGLRPCFRRLCHAAEHAAVGSGLVHEEYR